MLPDLTAWENQRNIDCEERSFETNEPDWDEIELEKADKEEDEQCNY